MDMNALIEQLEISGFLESVQGKRDVDIRELTYDSRHVAPGSLFICKGAAFKETYLAAALRQGAVAVLTETPRETPDEVCCVQVRDIRAAMAVAANLFYEAPWKDLDLIAVTGTKGKSTTVTMLKAIFDAHAEKIGDKPCALTSSSRVFDGIHDEAARLTTPETIDLYQYMATAREVGLTRMVVEVSSQALKYGRVAGICFDAAIFLNIAPDHIGPIEHPNFTDYFFSKLHLFDISRRAFVSTEATGNDAERQELKRAIKNLDDAVTFGLNDKALVRAENVQAGADGMHFILHHADGAFPVYLPLHGHFNVQNALAAASVALSRGVSPETISGALAQVRMPGHMTYLTGRDVTVIIDYAHNDISFREVFRTAENDFPGAYKTVVFGAPGNKAESRRANLGEVASRSADQIYLTADDPAFESVASICDEIQAAFVADVPVAVIEDRAAAIHTAIQKAPAGGVVLLLGKGHERAQKVQGQNVPWPGDEIIAQEALSQRDAQQQSSGGQI